MTDLLPVLEESRRLGFLGPGPVEPHIRHAAAFVEAVEHEPARALDLGAGGGLPGLILASRHWPGTRWTFLDSQLRRTDFLREAVRELSLSDRVQVITERAETLGHDPRHREQYDLVTARSFGPPAVTAECAAPLLRIGASLVVSEPPTASADRWPDDGLEAFGLEIARRLTTGEDRIHLVRLMRHGPVDSRFPRRVGVPAKRPVF